VVPSDWCLRALKELLQAERKRSGITDHVITIHGFIDDLDLCQKVERLINSEESEPVRYGRDSARLTG